MTTVTIEYCEPCGLKTPAENVKEELENSLDIEPVELEAGHGGVFKIYVDGEKVYDKANHDNQIKTDVIKKSIQEKQ